MFGVSLKQRSERMNCEKCGKKFGFIARVVTWQSNDFFPEYRNKKLCRECAEELKRLVSEKMESGRFCSNCKFFDEDSIEIDVGIFAPNLKFIPMYYCAKLDFALKSPYGDEAEKCTSYLTPEEYKLKALRGELNTKIVECQYCGKKYNPEKHEDCPKCGA